MFVVRVCTADVYEWVCLCFLLFVHHPSAITHTHEVSPKHPDLFNGNYMVLVVYVGRECEVKDPSMEYSRIFMCEWKARWKRTYMEILPWKIPVRHQTEQRSCPLVPSDLIVLSVSFLSNLNLPMWCSEQNLFNQMNIYIVIN